LIKVFIGIQRQPGRERRHFSDFSGKQFVFVDIFFDFSGVWGFSEAILVF
jgi:hypothetical protein